ncbi:hypothetical protein D9M71_118610 [compost metagenome]
MIDLVNVETHWLQGFGQPLKKLTRAGQAFVVVARLVQIIAGVDHLQLALPVALEQAKFWLQSGIQRPATIAQSLHLLLQDVAAVVWPRLVLNMTNAYHAAVTWLPWHWRE